MLQPDIDKLLSELGFSLGIAGLCFGHAASCQLIFDRYLVVTMIHDRANERITLNCPIGQAEQVESLSRQTLLAMLQANFMCQGCPNATLSCAEDKRAYLQIAIPLSDSSRCDLRGALEMLLNQAETWSERLGQSRDLEPIDSPMFSRSGRYVEEPLAWTRQKV